MYDACASPDPERPDKVRFAAKARMELWPASGLKRSELSAVATSESGLVESGLEQQGLVLS